MVSQEDFDALTARVEQLESSMHTHGGDTLPEVPTQKTVAKRGTRVTEDWFPSDRAVLDIRHQFPWMTPAQIHAEHQKFIDFWLSKAGKDAAKLDWDRTWRNWMRTAAERMPRARANRMSKVDQKAASYLDD